MTNLLFQVKLVLIKLPDNRIVAVCQPVLGDPLSSSGVTASLGDNRRDQRWWAKVHLKPLLDCIIENKWF